MRDAKHPGTRGSLKWMQRAVAERWPDLEEPILSRVAGAAIDWRSPLASDAYAEYSDGDFLRRLGLDRLTPALATFWPAGGPRWDALGLADERHVLLVEAKAHIGEFCSTATDAGDVSRAQIAASLNRVALALGSSRGALWSDIFYQYANRLAHLWFLRDAGVDAWLVLVGFLGDEERDGPEGAEAWRAAYQVAHYVLGLNRRHALARYIIHVHPSVRP